MTLVPALGNFAPPTAADLDRQINDLNKTAMGHMAKARKLDTVVEVTPKNLVVQGATLATMLAGSAVFGLGGHLLTPKASKSHAFMAVGALIGSAVGLVSAAKFVVPPLSKTELKFENGPARRLHHTAMNNAFLRIEYLNHMKNALQNLPAIEQYADNFMKTYDHNRNGVIDWDAAPAERPTGEALDRFKDYTNLIYSPAFTRNEIVGYMLRRTADEMQLSGNETT